MIDVENYIKRTTGLYELKFIDLTEEFKKWKRVNKEIIVKRLLDVSETYEYLHLRLL